MADATETKTYTFTKSEEIFAEAQNVRYLREISCARVLRFGVDRS